MAEIDHVVVPGTFDPITYGHIDVIKRASRMFDHVTVAVAASVNKRGCGTAFTLEERTDMVKEALLEEGVTSGVDVMSFDGLLVDFCRQIDAHGIVKGLRAMTDFEYELQQADLNFRMAKDIESIFVMSSPEYGFVSSSVVREIASFGSDVHLLVPPCIQRKLVTHYGK